MFLGMITELGVHTAPIMVDPLITTTVGAEGEVEVGVGPEGVINPITIIQITEG